MSTSLASWRSMWRELGAAAAQDLYRELVAAWSERHRHYHTLEHLRECLDGLAAVRASAERPAEIELALWFHDAVYDPHRGDNEERSAQWARLSTLQSGLSAAVADRVHALVMATRHAALPGHPDAQLVADIDLAILGAPRERYDQFERQVRAEYAHVPDRQFRAARRKILEDFLARPRIYSTEHFFAQRETAARANLHAAITRLEG